MCEPGCDVPCSRLRALLRNRRRGASAALFGPVRRWILRSLRLTLESVFLPLGMAPFRISFWRVILSEWVVSVWGCGYSFEEFTVPTTLVIVRGLVLHRASRELVLRVWPCVNR